ncbi:Hypothetical predicted protein [Olea europaea subsp. europaea]|uniref:Uncharacterized protein n=1 Tax=Olea europaea subsp. europaea TaxID=158383 RepID=A0A8S0PA01_OLEEU|nr:Hypothetical predicted protein [Olea europaea subsp. europaea]
MSIHNSCNTYCRSTLLDYLFGSNVGSSPLAFSSIINHFQLEVSLEIYLPLRAKG